VPLHVIDHPLVSHRVAAIRDPRTTTAEFRLLVSDLSTFLAYEATRTLPTVTTAVRTPLDVDAEAKVLASPAPIVVPILRAGLGLLDGMLRALPTAEVAVIGLKRDEVTFEPIQYCAKVPDRLDGRPAFVVDPMLATGGSLVAAFDLLAKAGAGSLTAISVIAAPEGVEKTLAAYPDANIVVAALDDGLNENAYIVPGLGDAGDRLFGPA
jgi:uracil phosphoribosyltransferase